MDTCTQNNPAAAGSPPAVAAAGQHALPTDNMPSNSASLASVGPSAMPIDSAVNAHSNGVAPIAAAAAVVELQSASSSLPSSTSSADSAKSQNAALSLGSSAQASLESQRSSGSKDTGEKQFSSPSRGPIASDPKAMLLNSSRKEQPQQQQGRNSSPSQDRGAAPSSAGVGAGGSSGISAAPALSPLEAAFAAVASTFNQRKVFSASSSAGSDRMCDGEHGSAAAAAASSSLAALPRTTDHCLVVDHQHLVDDDRKALSAICDMKSVEAMIAAVLQWLPALKSHEDGRDLVWIAKHAGGVPRLHLHFRNHGALTHALQNAPHLVRCGVYSPFAWSREHQLKTCCGREIFQYPEALHFSLEPKESATPNAEEFISQAKRFLDSIGMPFQYVWQSGAQKDHMKKSTPGKITFWVLPREANLDALAATINRINMRHTLLGGSVSVQGPNSPQLQRCWECRLLGHNDTACPKFSGTAVRLRFKLPFGPYEFSQLVEGSNTIRAAMLGNTHAREAWMPSYKATLFFNTPSTPEEVNSFRQTLQTVSDLCQDRLHEPPHPVVMTQALRKSECVACGSRNSGHRCIFAGVARPQPQQSHAAVGKPAPSPAAATGTSPVSKPKPSEPAQTIEASMVHGMCGQCCCSCPVSLVWSCWSISLAAWSKCVDLEAPVVSLRASGPTRM